MKRFMGIMAMVLAAFQLPAPAAWGHDRHRPASGGQVVEVWYAYDDGRRLPVYEDGRSGDVAGRYWLEAVYGRNYRIAVRNVTGGRIGVVVAVDGRNIVSGGRSDLRPDERMYVLGPWETAYLDGWRTSKTEVRRFYFTEPKRSYSIRAFGDGSAMGVIGIAAYREQAPPQPPEPPVSWNFFDRGGAAPSAKAERKLGTGFGRPEYAPVRTVSFEPEPSPAWKALFRYETRAALCRLGIVETRERPNRLWDDPGFAPYPAD